MRDHPCGSPQHVQVLDQEIRSVFVQRRCPPISHIHGRAGKPRPAFNSRDCICQSRNHADMTYYNLASPFEESLYSWPAHNVRTAHALTKLTHLRSCTISVSKTPAKGRGKRRASSSAMPGRPWALAPSQAHDPITTCTPPPAMSLKAMTTFGCRG